MSRSIASSWVAAGTNLPASNIAIATQWRAPRPPPSAFHFSAIGSAFNGSRRASCMHSL